MKKKIIYALLLMVGILFPALSGNLYQVSKTASVTQDTVRNFSSRSLSTTGFMPEVIPPSPQMESFQTFTDIPVSYATGVPDISIPLYTMKSGNIEIPVVLRYHTHNVKPHMALSTNVALGWSVEYGGSLSRTVVGMPDEDLAAVDADKVYSENNEDDFNALFWASRNESDYQSDWFHYSMPTGESGRFFLERKLYSGSFSDRYDCWLLPNTEARVDATTDTYSRFNTFTITDRYGLQCTYGGNYCEWTGENGYSGWMLHRVYDLKSGRSVNYTYSSYVDSESDQLEQSFNGPCSVLSDEDPRSSGGLYSGVYYQNSLLHGDASVCEHRTDPEILYLDDNCLGAKRRDCTAPYPMSYNCWKVSRITGDNTTIDFTYTGSGGNKISQIQVTCGGTVIKTITFTTRQENDIPVLDSISITGKTGSETLNYRFDYSTLWTSDSPDYWGFATERSAVNSGGSAYYTQNRSLTYTKMNGNIQAGYDFSVNGNPGVTSTTSIGTHDFSGNSSALKGLLTKITYPTGGYCALTYETGSYQSGTTSKTGGAPRVKSITDYPLTGSSKIRTFTYQAGKTDVSPETLGIYLNAAQQVDGNAPGRTISLMRRISNRPHFGLDIDVYYPQVDVTYTDGTSSFKEVYCYNTTREHTHNIFSLLDEYPRYYVSGFFTNPLKGKLLQKKVYDSASNLKLSEAFTYQTSVRKGIDNLLVLAQIESLNYAAKALILSEEDNGFLDYPVYQYDHYTINVPTATLVRKTVTAYDGSTPVVTTEDYTYATGSDVKLTKKEISRSGGSTLTEDYTYVSSSSANGTSLMNANMVGLQETVTSTQGGQSESLKYAYTAGGLNDKVWYRQGNGDWKLRSTMEYGGYGNPLAAYGLDNMPVCYVWAYGGRHPLARIDGLTYTQYSEVKNTLQNWLAYTDNTNLTSVLDTLRSTYKAKGAHVTGRLYDNTTGNVVQEMLPSGETVDYTYDGLGRLTAVKDDNAKTVRAHTYSMGSNSNYIFTREMLNNTGSSSSNVQQWFDGLGRPLETVDIVASTSGKHLVTLTEYDQAGRTVKQWLPYAGGGNYVEPSTLKSSIGSANYGGDTRPFRETQYEASTLGRPLKEYAPGSAWGTHPKTMEYLSNTASGVLECKVYGVSTANALTGGTSYYAAGQLSVTKITDEDGKVNYTFTDKQGQKLLERAVNGSECLDTYYVYDNYDNLRFVLQPEYQDTADVNRYAFQYKYDTLKRCTWKKLPGASGVTMEYDDADRMIFSQDGVQGTSKWTYYVYDNLGRLTKQGENTTKAVGSSPYLQNYYDKYEDFIAVAGSGYDNDQTGNSYGYLTGTVQEVFGQTTKIYTAYYYDNLGQVTKEVKSNLLGGYDTTETVYTFSGKPATVTHTHTATGKTTRTEVYTYTYDGKDRLTKVTHKLGSTTVTLAEYTYDALGRQATKKLHGSNTLTYSYNIQNWLTGISSTKFTQTLGYGSNYNGNISSMSWTADGSSHSYAFTYDGVNRMLNATHGTGAYTEKVTAYDKNGNIVKLQRYSNGLIDDLSYTYSGNQLTNVKDESGNTAGFTDGANVVNEYTYDNNGNLTKDSNKNISNITYNVLNLPSTVTFSDGSTIVYSYAADGTKLRTVHSISGTTITKDYCANVVYENGVQKLLQTEEGYVDLSASTPAYYYYLKDHQGNNRIVLSSGGTVAETNHYYPFGGVFASTGNVQPYKYNGKELDTKKGLNWYDYGARHYDAALGCFTSVDPSSENYFETGLYAYCGSNPINRIDPNGADWYQDNNGNLHWQKGSETLEGYTNIGATASIQLGENSYLNFYQNGGIWANQAVNAFDLINASPKLRSQFLGTGSILSEDDQITLLRSLVNKQSAGLVQPIALEALSWSIGGLGGKVIGKVVNWGLSRILGNATTNGYKSFAAFKKVYGTAGEGQAWHHIVEQNPSNIAKFGAERIHNINNMVKLPHGKGSIHAKVTGYYNSKPEFTNGLTVRNWLKTKNYEEQFEFGIKVLESFGW